MGGHSCLMAAKRMPGTVVAVIRVDTCKMASSKMPGRGGFKGLLKMFETNFAPRWVACLANMLNANANRPSSSAQAQAAAQDPKDGHRPHARHAATRYRHASKKPSSPSLINSQAATNTSAHRWPK